MKHYSLSLLLCLALCLFVSCREQDPTRVTIVCTGDVHGNLFSYDFLTGDSAQGSLARVSSYLKQLRREECEVVYLDNGDMLQGSPATYCYNTHAVGEPHVAAVALGYLQCDAVVLGNNDIEPGGPTYQRYVDDLSCAVLGGNIYIEGTESPFLPPYTIIEREGVKIAVLGLTTPAIPHWIPKCQWPELYFANMEQAAHRWIQHLREYASPDLVIGLFHSGYEGGIVTDEYAANATRRVAEQVPGFDAIFYGHDHEARIAEVVNVAGDTVLLLNPGRDARQVAALEVTLGKEEIRRLSPSLVDMNSYIPDPEYMAAMNPHIERIKRYVNRVIGTSARSASMSEALDGPSPLIDFIHQLQLKITGADISFAAPLVMDGVLPEGEVTVRDIYRLLPYENTLYTLYLTGREVKNYLELSYDKWLTQKESPLEYQNFDSAAGIIYEVDTTQRMGQRVRIKRMSDGTPFRMDARYLVAVNSYRAHGGGMLMTEGAGIAHEELLRRIAYSTTADLRFHMISHIEMQKTVTPTALDHWRFVHQ